MFSIDAVKQGKASRRRAWRRSLAVAAFFPMLLATGVPASNAVEAEPAPEVGIGLRAAMFTQDTKCIPNPERALCDLAEKDWTDTFQNGMKLADQIVANTDFKATVEQPSAGARVNPRATVPLVFDKALKTPAMKDFRKGLKNMQPSNGALSAWAVNAVLALMKEAEKENRSLTWEDFAKVGATGLPIVSQALAFTEGAKEADVKKMITSAIALAAVMVSYSLPAVGAAINVGLTLEAAGTLLWETFIKQQSGREEPKGFRELALQGADIEWGTDGEVDMEIGPRAGRNTQHFIFRSAYASDQVGSEPSVTYRIPTDGFAWFDPIFAEYARPRTVTFWQTKQVKGQDGEEISKTLFHQSACGPEWCGTSTPSTGEFVVEPGKPVLMDIEYDTAPGYCASQKMPPGCTISDDFAGVTVFLKSKAGNTIEVDIPLTAREVTEEG